MIFQQELTKLKQNNVSIVRKTRTSNSYGTVSSVLTCVIATARGDRYKGRGEIFEKIMAANFQNFVLSLASV